MRSKFFQKVFYNWQIKIICFLLAVLVYFLLFYSIESSRTMTLPLTVTLPENYTAESNIPTTVDLVIQGTEDQIYMIDVSGITVSADFSTVSHEGVNYAPVAIETGELGKYIDTSVISIYTKPSQVKVYFTNSGENR
jgi:GH25 family lysozyme M1 (1,4-beta-N-acetylmuramidase)